MGSLSKKLRRKKHDQLRRYAGEVVGKLRKLNQRSDECWDPPAPLRVLRQVVGRWKLAVAMWAHAHKGDRVEHWHVAASPLRPPAKEEQGDFDKFMIRLWAESGYERLEEPNAVRGYDGSTFHVAWHSDSSAVDQGVMRMTRRLLGEQFGEPLGGAAV